MAPDVATESALAKQEGMRMEEASQKRKHAMGVFLSRRGLKCKLKTVITLHARLRFR